MCQLRGAVVQELLLVRGEAGTDHHKGDARFAPAFVLHPDDGGLRHRRVGQQRRLDLGGGHVLAAGNVDVLEPVDDFDVALGVALHQVSGAQPATGQDGRGGGGIAEVAGEDPRAAHQQLSGRGAVENLPGHRIGHRDGDMRVWFARVADHPCRILVGQAEHIGRRLGQPVALAQRHSPAVPDPQQRRGHGGSAHHRVPQAAELGGGEVGMFGEHQVLGGDTHQHRDPAFRDQLQDPAGFEAAFQHHGGARPPGQQRLDVPAADVELRQHRQHDVGAAQIEGPGQREVGPEAVGVGQHGGLAGPLGAGREDHQEGVVVAHFPLQPRPSSGPSPAAGAGWSGTAGARTFRRRRGPARLSGAGAAAARRRPRRANRVRPRRAAAAGRRVPAGRQVPGVKAARTAAPGPARPWRRRRTPPRGPSCCRSGSRSGPPSRSRQLSVRRRGRPPGVPVRRSSGCSRGRRRRSGAGWRGCGPWSSGPGCAVRPGGCVMPIPPGSRGT